MITAAEITESDPFASLAARMEVARAEFSAYLDTLPQERPCPNHPHVTTFLDRENTPRNGNALYPCAECAADRKKAARIARLEDVGIPSDALSATLENFDTHRPKVNPDFQTPQQFLEAAQRFQAGEIRNMILAGTPGIGKGHLAAALAIEASDKGKKIEWSTCSALFNEYHMAYASNQTGPVLESRAVVDLLVLDEICLRDLPADGEEILFAIFEYRHKKRLPSILLGNKPADKCREWLGGRILDRLRSGGVAFRYGEWESMRGTQGDGAQFEI